MTAKTQLPIAVDAMGGDNAPHEVVRGALQAALAYGCEIALVGQTAVLERSLLEIEGPESAARGHVTIVEAAEVVGMDEHPANAVRSKKDSSIVRACGMVASGDAGAAVSAGNSGATMAAALFAVKRIAGVARPALGTLLPGRSGPTFVLDVGGNVDCKAEWLLQFGVMGSVYARTMMGVAAPRIGLLSNGEEPGKGSHLVQETFELLKASNLSFRGNVEAKELFHSVVDVAVCDGFVGNMVLKTAEGTAEFLFSTMKSELTGSTRGKLGGLLVKPGLRGIRDRLDYRETGGALLLGVAGEVVIAHGRSDALAVKHAIRVARQAVQNDVSGVITRELAPAAEPVKR